MEQLVYAATIVLSVSFPVIYIVQMRKREKRARARLEKTRKEGIPEPVTLHPKIDPYRCIAIGACVSACPEGEIIGIVNGRAMLVSPDKCIGHGACMSACPVDAISLVFGTEKRGVEIPHVKETFETNVPGLYIAGELGGMGLIRNAVTQGRQAMENIARSLQRRDPGVLDVLIVGAGPAGLSATLQAIKSGLRYVTIDQDDIGGAILTYPRQKLVMTQPMEIPLFGKYKRREIRKEELLELWHHIIQKNQVKINTFEKLMDIQRTNGAFTVKTSKGEYKAQRVLLAIGRRGTPRKLGVPGENSSKVAYKLIDPEQYRGKKVLVVGGGDSAIEAAVTLGEQAGTEVLLSYRKNVFSRIKPKNRERIEAAARAGRVTIFFESHVKEIRKQEVLIKQHGKLLQFANDYVLVFIGGEMPTKFLNKLGIQIEMKFGES
ncbi:MAG: NAD(P)-binding domain-containing protein [candidate division KSB1 bacterium]|nr:NAD(P)-binding domain-containing protein [candidate division KSB1 bacterium]MDQ7066334.1 NAD(P)-binding domain-containing protein [candidate division KSB1 bacterium]